MKKFKLWLEFEEAMLWEDKTNGFGYISVDLLDGRRYTINVWTFSFLETAIKQETADQTDGKGIYVIPPDLFVKELSRSCVEAAVESLLERGKLEDFVHEPTFGLSFIAPWEAADQLPDLGASLKEELLKELNPEHPLHGQAVEILAKRQDNDHVLIQLENKQLILVELTWSGKQEEGDLPLIAPFLSKKDFWERKMRESIVEFKKA